MPNSAWNTILASDGRRLSSDRLAILVPEELRVPQPRAQHALIAGDDRRAAVAGLDIGDQDEAAGQRPSVVRSAKYFWLLRIVVTSASGGTAMNCLVDGAQERHRPFDQPLELVEQAGIVAEH